MRIRDANINDINSIVRLWHAMMDLHCKYNEIFKMKDNAVDLYTGYISGILQGNSKKVFVAEENNSIVGYVFGEIIQQPPVYLETDLGSINEISVDESYRRNGIGKRLIVNCLNWFRENEINRIDIVIALDNPISQGFWKKLGFRSYNESCYLKI